MKPLEILGMIEEVAGTRRYEEARIDSRRRMERKNKKLEEVKVYSLY